MVRRVACLLVCGWLSCALATDASTRSWSVRDSIELTTIVALASQTDIEHPWLYSPDRKSFLLLIEKGDIERDTVMCELRVFAVEAVRAALLARKTRDTALGRTIARAQDGTDQEWTCMDEVRWSSDGRHVSYLAAAPDGTRQLFRSEVATGTVQQLSFHPKGILQYSASPSRYVLSAWEPPDNSAHDGDPFVVDKQWVYQVMDPRRMDGGLLRYTATYSVDREGKNGVSFAEPMQRRFWSDWSYWISSDGRHAVGLRRPRQTSEHWRHHRPGPDALPLAFNLDAFAQQFVKIDLASGAVTPVFDALTGESLQRGGKVEAQWSSDGKRVVLVNTFLPPSAPSDLPEADPAVVEIEIETGRWRKIRTIEDSPATRRAVANGASGNESKRIRLSIAEDSNTPPELFAALPGSARAVALTDLNPQLQAIQRPEVELIEWRDAQGRAWSGGLVRPIGTRPGERLPIVIHYWFYPKRFQPDGPITSAFVAASLASKGVAVLGIKPARELDEYSQAGAAGVAEIIKGGMEAAIDHLVAAGVADRERVGLLGFSRSGYLMKYFLTHSSHPIRAAVVAASSDLGYWQYLTLVGESAAYPRFAFEQANGGKPFWQDPEAWLRHSPGLNAGKANAALRLEAYDRLEAVYTWEFFAAFRILGKPVEMSVIPEGAHVLHKPSHRLLSQGGNADWFAFWLKGEEDPVPEKAEQYRRWRALRALDPRSHQ